MREPLLTLTAREERATCYATREAADAACADARKAFPGQRFNLVRAAGGYLIEAPQRAFSRWLRA